MEEQIIEKNTRTVRFSDAPWYTPGYPVLVIGAGGIGSWLSFLLARQDLDITVYDFDNVDHTNLGGQLYDTQSLNQKKVTVLSKIIKDFSNITINTYSTAYTKDDMAYPIMFAALDNIETRRIMYENWITNIIKNPKFDNKACLFIDGRLLAESGKIFILDRNNYKDYEQYLYDDSSIKEQPCSFKATSHSAAIIAGIMVSCFNNYITNVLENMKIREVPFLIEFDLPLMSFENK